MRSQLTRPPDPPPIIIQHKRNRNKPHTQEAQQATRPPHPELMVHRIREQRKRRPERTPHQIIPRKHAGDILRIRIPQVRQHGHEEQKRAHAEERTADDGHDPMHARPRRPAEPEEADGDEEGADEGRLQADLGPQLALGVELRFHVAVIVVEKGNHGDDGADEDADEGETLGAEGEAVDADEDDGKGFEPEVEEAVDEGEVEVEEEADGFGEGEGEGPDEDHGADFLAGHAFGFDLGFALHARVVGQGSDAHGAAVEDVAAAGFGEEEEEEEEAEAGEPH